MNHYFTEPTFPRVDQRTLADDGDELHFCSTCAFSKACLAEGMDKAALRELHILVEHVGPLPAGAHLFREGELAAKARGIVAELVASRLTGLPHNKGYLRSSYRRSRKRADIGENVEVRNTKDHTGPLVLYDNDPDERVALLVTGIDPFVLRGWIRVEHGKLRHLYKRDGDLEKWIVPQSMLHPMPLPVDA